MTASDLQELLIATLVRHSGGTKRAWRLAVGPVVVHDLMTHRHCNWSVHPAGGPRQNSEIEQLLDVMRLDHPLVESD